MKGNEMTERWVKYTTHAPDREEIDGRELYINMNLIHQFRLDASSGGTVLYLIGQNKQRHYAKEPPEHFLPKISDILPDQLKAYPTRQTPYDPNGGAR